jgi:hypothetical protein
LNEKLVDVIVTVFSPRLCKIKYIENDVDTLAMVLKMLLPTRGGFSLRRSI